MLTLKQFEAFFKEVELSKSELVFFMDDARDAIGLEYTSIKDYYINEETQYCLKKYTFVEYEIPMLSGLHKILTHLK